MNPNYCITDPSYPNPSHIPSCYQRVWETQDILHSIIFFFLEIWCLYQTIVTWNIKNVLVRIINILLILTCLFDLIRFLLLSIGIGNPWEFFTLLNSLSYLFLFTDYCIVMYLWVYVVKTSEILSFKENFTKLKYIFVIYNVFIYTVFFLSWYLVFQIPFFVSIVGVIIAIFVIITIIVYSVWGRKLFKMAKKSPALSQSPEKLQHLVQMDFFVQINVGIMYITVYAALVTAFMAFIWLTPKSLVVYEFIYCFIKALYVIALLYFFRPTQRTKKLEVDDSTIATFTTSVTSQTFSTTELSTTVTN